jgi:hypothetical protein
MIQPPVAINRSAFFQHLPGLKTVFDDGIIF